MFKKKPHVKALAPIRSSDRRRLADQIINDYGLASKDGSTDPDGADSAKTAHTELRNALLPDGTQSARFVTTTGPDQKQVSGTLYVGHHPDQEERVLWFRLDGDTLYPTVFSLWQHPGIVPLLHTPELVVKKIQQGADLMTPGLAGPPFPPGATKGAIVAVASLNAPSVPVSVGLALVDIASLSSVQGAKGHAVDMLHWFGDELWSHNSSQKSEQSPPEEIPAWLDHLNAATAQLSLQDSDDGGAALPMESVEVTASATNASDATDDGVADTQGDAPETTKDTAVPKTYSTKELDEIFRNAFLYGAREQLRANPSVPAHGLNFPLTQSFIMSNLIQPYLPIFSPEDTKQIQIKNTSFKGLKRFIKSLDDARIVKSKVKPNESVILDIDFKDESITSFSPTYRLPRKDASSGPPQGSGNSTSTSNDASDPSIGQTLSLSTLYKVPERLSPLFASAPSRPFHTSAEIKAATTAYIESESLASASNRRLVSLDPFLANEIFNGTTGLDKEVQAKGLVARDALTDRVLQACAAHFTITRTSTGSSAAGDGGAKPRPGPPPRVRITLETRSGNKTVTKISGLERFHVAPGLLADELRKTCAGSTVVEPLAGASPKEKLSEVMVQGPQRDGVLRALEKRGVKGAWVEVLDKVKKKK